MRKEKQLVFNESPPLLVPRYKLKSTEPSVMLSSSICDNCRKPQLCFPHIHTYLYTQRHFLLTIRVCFLGG